MSDPQPHTIPLSQPEDSLLRRAIPLSAFWFLTLGGMGLFFPYFGLYLHENIGLRSDQVGAVFAVFPLVGFVAQPFWGVVADRTGLRTRILIVLGIGTVIGYVLLGQLGSFVSLLFGAGLFAFFARALMPMTVSVSLASLQDNRHAFGLVRVWGTLGFFCCVVGFPFLLDRYQAAYGLSSEAGGPSEPGLALLFPLAAVLTAGAVLVGRLIPNRGAVALQAIQGEWRQLFRHGPFLRLAGLAFCAFFFLNGPMDLFPIYIRARGGDLDTVRSMWIMMLIPEIGLVAFLGAGVARFGARGLLAIGIGAGSLRWLLCASIESLTILYPIQMLHAVVVTGLMMGAPLYVDASIPPQLRSTGQAVLGMIGMGLGGTGSSLFSGWLLEHYGPTAPYWVGGIGALALMFVLPWLLPPPARPEDTPEVLPKPA
jgi:PPP family 3-phenylpropionic acid transporter